MNKRRLYIRVVAAVLIILSLLAIAYFCEHPPLFYYVHLTDIQELPTRLIRTAFRAVADCDLPEKADGLRAIFKGGREPSIFVRFKTDYDGIAYILETFDVAGVKSETLDADFLRALTASHASIFHIPSLWQEKIGVNIFDQKSIESGRRLEYIPGPDTGKAPGYRIFIDNQRSTVYIHSWLH
jgi:hypothetical protein